MTNDELREAVEAASIPLYMTEKAEIIDYYKDTYGERWKSELVSGLMGIISPRLSRATLMRRFQGGREESTRLTRKARAEYERLGRTLPPAGYRPPESGYRVEFNIWMVISGECPMDAEERDQTIYLRGQQALDFLLNPTFDTILFYYFNERQIAVWCPEAGESWAIVEPIEESEAGASEDEDDLELAMEE